MRLLLFLLVAALLSTTGCTAYKIKDNSATSPATSPSEFAKVEFPSPTNDAETLVQYAAYLRRLNATDLNREHETLKQNVAKSKTDLSRAQLGMIYALPGLALRDDTKALSILEALGKEASSSVVRNFALLLLGFVADNKRLDEGTQALNTKLKDEQKQSAELQQKLEALKSIEKSLSERDRSKQPASNKQP
jgi:hypothetical protein